MSEVFHAVDTRLTPPRSVALKCLHSHLALDRALIRMFDDEARITASLDHPNIVVLHGALQLGDHYALVLEWVDGCDLRKVENGLRDAGVRVPVDVAASIGRNVLDALGYAHARASAEGEPHAIIHRDISPQNILVSRTGRVKVSDFGVAKVRGGRTTTSVGTVKGKYAYMAPEQIRGEPLDGRADLYALGVVLFELSLGVRPFGNLTGLKLVDAVVEGRFAQPETIDPAVPAAYAALLRRALACDATKRFQSADEMAAALRDAVGARGDPGTDPAAANVQLAAWVQEFAPPADDDGAFASPFEPYLAANPIVNDGDEQRDDATKVREPLVDPSDESDL